MALTSESWERLQKLFHDAIEQSPGEWRKYLELCAPGEPEVVERVMAMLNADREASLLDRASFELASSLLETSDAAIGRHIGPYRITKLIGEGGMGVVYLGQRADLGTQAAIKVLRDAWVSPSRRERFAAEQRTLAQLNHPAIAHMYDAGTLDDGTPWIVMEHVEGVPITEACRARGLGLRDRLLLFRTVCEAVVHAHQHLVVHRDVKPSNILVRTDGTVKLLDFGIAKHLEQLEDSKRTQTGLRLMTPAYAAPEQVRGSAVGVYTDVYALGVVLYELLTGRLPHDLSTSTPGEAERQILETEPDRVSVAARGRRERHLMLVNRAQWNDLDVLCATAMQKEPARRYASVDALIRDIDNFLGGAPLAAQPDSVQYRATRFVSRNRRLVTAAAVVVAVIVALNVFYTFRLTTARDVAVAEAARTERIQRFVTSLFEGGDPAAGPAESLRVVTLVDRGVAQARSLTSEPAIQAELFATLGGIYQKLGQLDRADTLLNDALVRRTGLLGDSAADVGASMVALGLLRTDQAQYAVAESLTRAGLAIALTSLQRGHPQVADATEALGKVLSEKGDYTAAIPVLEDAIRQRAAGGRETAEYASSVYELANVQFYSGNYDASDSLNRVVLALHKRLYGEKHPSTSDDLINLGAGQFERGNYPEAERFYREALAITIGHYGRDHHKTAANLTMVGRSLVMQQKYDAATEVLRDALAVRERVYGPVHPAVASTVNELGSIALQQDRYSEAEAAYSRMISIYTKAYNNKHYLIGIAQSNLASTMMARGNNRGAEALFRQAIAMYNQTLPPTNTNIGIAKIKLGRTLLRQRRYAEAENASRAGYEALKSQLNPTVSWLVAARTDMAAAYDSLRRPVDAARIRAEIDSIAKQVAAKQK